jgi:hypothetical protein
MMTSNSFWRTLNTRIKIRNTLVLFLLALPASTLYELHDYGMGSGGNSVSESSTYGLKGITGEVSGQDNAGTTYDLGPGLEFTQQANVPAAPAFTNTASYYNKLKFTLDTGSNPSDATFMIAISTDNFSTTNYIQADNTIGATAVYQTYAAWGGASGAFVIGLTPNTTYKIKVKAIHTKYNESAYSAEASASTSVPSLSYDLDVSATDQETAAPYTVAFGTLAVGSVTTATDKIWVDLDTNAESGAFIYVYNSTTGLTSANASYTITSATANLASASEGFGLQISTDTETTGGPLLSISPYNNSSENVGIIDTTPRNIFTSSSNPITGGRGSVLLKAKASVTTPAASDYTSTINIIASATF